MRSSVRVIGVVPGGIAAGAGTGCIGALAALPRAGDPICFEGGGPPIAGALAVSGTAGVGSGVDRFVVIGSRVMWQMGHSPGSLETICGCMGQWYLGTDWVDASAPCSCALA